MKVFLVVIRILAAVICGLLALSFLATIISGIINPVNVISLIFCAAVILLAVLYPRLKNKKAVNIALAAAAVCIVYSAVISVIMLTAILKEPEIPVQTAAAGDAPTHTVIVLGCKVMSDGKPSEMLKARLDKAAEYARDNPEAVIILSGGQGDNEPVSEAHSMKEYLISAGISEKRLYTEENSENTSENIRFSKKIIDESSLPENTVIISECYHIYRALRYARAAGLDAQGVSAGLSWYWYMIPTYWVREILALTRDFVTGI